MLYNYFAKFHFVSQHKERSLKCTWPQTKSNNQHIHKCENRVDPVNSPRPFLKVQRRAARWVKQEYSMTTSVTAILNNLEWNLQSKHQQFSRLTLFFKFLHQDPLIIRIPQRYLPSTLTHYTRHIYSSSTLHPTFHIYNILPKEFLSWDNY